MKIVVLKVSCNDKLGIVSAVSQSIASVGGLIDECGQFVDKQSKLLFMRVCFRVDDGMKFAQFKDKFSEVAEHYEMAWDLFDMTVKPRVLIMVSQLGHCLNDLLYRNSIDQLPMELVGIVSNHETFRRRAEHEGVPFYYSPVTPDNKREQEAFLLDLVEEKNVDLVILARYMQILTDELSNRLSGRVINIHHSFLPSFKGAKPYHQAHKRGVKLIGATAHYVTADLDEGPIIEQDVRRVDHSADADTMVAIGRDTESQVLARAVKLHLEQRILLNHDRTIIFA
ncbi:formyltetrahydrofolate deformylase [Caballeronia sp. DA-9]|uniref:formyltetrahydrofolate deformylase n=1 Tax=Caballeronia sp. DA-9 TaxID=3436237 RepID=UPI003F674316